MRTKPKIRGCGLVLAGLTLIVSLPELARAQQSGLFPLAPIKRQRVPCDQEDPVYKGFKATKYFGYYPPCWRPFPAGWGCPSPEKPDVEKAFKDLKLGAGGIAPSGETGGVQQGDQPLGQPNIPDLPRERSPFDTPEPPGGNRPANPAAPRQEQREPASPFDTPGTNPPGNPAGAPAAAPRTGRAQPASPLGGEASPELSAPEQPARLEGTHARRSPHAAADGPLLSVGDITVPPVTSADEAFGAQPAQNATITADAAPAQTARPPVFSRLAAAF